jgi:hypothetical protein
MTNVAELPLFIHIGAGNVGFGIAVAAWGGGQIVGARLASRITDARLERTALIAGSALAAAALGLSGAIPSFAAVALLFVVVGVGKKVERSPLSRQSPTAQLGSRFSSAVSYWHHSAGVGSTCWRAGSAPSP